MRSYFLHFVGVVGVQMGVLMGSGVVRLRLTNPWPHLDPHLDPHSPQKMEKMRSHSCFSEKVRTMLTKTIPRRDSLRCVEKILLLLLVLIFWISSLNGRNAGTNKLLLLEAPENPPKFCNFSSEPKLSNPSECFLGGGIWGGDEVLTSEAALEDK